MRAVVKVLMFVLPVMLVIIFGVMGMGVISGMSPEPEAREESPRGLALFVEEAELTTIQLNVETQGEVSPKREIVVAPQIAGRISYVSPNFLEGGFIRRGEVLIRLEAADYELGVVRARSTVATAEQRLAQEVAEADIARQDLEGLGITDASPLARREPQLAEARAALASAEAQLADAQLALKRTAVVAPFDGRVRELNANIGQFVGAGTPLGTIFSSDVVEIDLPLTDNELGRLGLSLAFEDTKATPGPEVVFSADVAGQTRTWTGTLKRTAAAVSPRTRLITAIAEVEDPYGKAAELSGMPLAPGLYVNAAINGRTVENVVKVPRASLRGLDQVYVGDPETGTLSIRQVRVVDSSTEGAFLLSGVEPGEYVITSPIKSVVDGMRISFADPELDKIAKASAVADGADREALK